MASAGGDGASAFPGWSRPDVVLLTILCAAQSVLMVDVVVVNVALPSIQAELAVPTEMLQLVGVAYTGVFGSLLIVSGRVGDLYGRRRVVVTGLVLFVSMSGVCGVVQETWQLFAARAARGSARRWCRPTPWPCWSARSVRRSRAVVRSAGGSRRAPVVRSRGSSSAA